MKKFLFKTVMFLVLLVAGFLNAGAQLPLVEGDLAITFRSGQVSSATNANAVLAILKSNNTSTAVPGNVWTLPSAGYGGTKPAWYSAPSWTAANLGDIFGITIDNFGNIIVSSTQIYNGVINNRIFQIAGVTGAITTITPSGAVGSFGNIKFTKIGSDGYLYFSDWGNGLIHCMKRIGNANNAAWVSQPSFNPEFGRVGGGPDDNSSVKQLPYGLAIRKTLTGKRLYYSRIGRSEGANGNCPANSTPSPVENEIWSVDLNASGGFTAATETIQTGEYLYLSTGTYYFQHVLTNNNYAHRNPIADIAFSNDGKRMLVGQQSLGTINCLNAHLSEVGEFIETTPNNWVASGKTFPTGNGNGSNSTSQSNAVGGISYSNNVLYRDSTFIGCDTTVWAVTDAIQFQNYGPIPVPPLISAPAGTNSNNVYGLMGYTNQGITPYNATSTTQNYGNALLMDEDDDYNNHDKYFLGDVEAFKRDSTCNPLPCNCGHVAIDPVIGNTPINDTVTLPGTVSGLINYAYQCSGGGCSATYNWQITNNSSTTIASGNTFPIDLSMVNIPSSCGVYTLVIYAYCGTKACDSVFIHIKVSLGLNLTQTNVICQTLGTATVNAVGGVGPYTYLWAPGNLTTQTINAAAGTYSVTVTDFTGCTATGTVVVGTTVSTVAFNITSTDFICTAGGTATVNITSGTSPFTYLWTPGNLTTQTVTGLPPGTYSVTVTDVNGCTNTGNVTINDECNQNFCSSTCSFSGSIGSAMTVITPFNCGDTLQMLCNTQYTGGVNYTCTTTPVVISFGITVVTGPVTNVPSANYFFTVPGFYSFTYYAYQNGHLCDSCKVYVKVTCPVNCCAGSSWGPIKSKVNNVVISAKTAAVIIPPKTPKIYCGDTVKIKCTDKFYLSTTFNCPAPCVGSVIYTLTTPYNSIFYTGAGPINNVTLSTAGLYTLTIDGYCTDPLGNKTKCATCKIYIKVTGTIFIPLAPITGVNSVCKNSPPVFLSIAEAGGRWSSSDAAVATVNANGKVTPVSAGSTIIRYTKNCYNNPATILFTVYDAPAIPVISGVSSLCAGTTAQLYVNSASGTWSTANPARVTVTADGVITGVSAGAARVYYIVTNSSGCTAIGSQLITVYRSPSVPTFTIATPPANFNAACIGYTTSLINQRPTGGVFASSNLNVATIDNSNILRAVGAGFAAVSYTVSNSYGCSSAKSFNLGVVSCPLPKPANLVKTNDLPVTAADWIRIFPNPAKGNSVVQLSVASVVKYIHGSITIHDMYGKQLFTKTIGGESDLKITIGNWAKGIYLVNIIYGTENKVGRLVIE